MMVRTGEEFFDFFSDISLLDMHQLRDSPLLEGWPPDQVFYVSIATEFFDHFGDDGEKRQKFVQIMRQMAIHDGRTFSALIWIAQLETLDPYRYTGVGVNSLAGLANGLRNAALSEEDKAIWRNCLEPFLAANVEGVACNAKACLNIIDSAPGPVNEDQQLR